MASLAELGEISKGFFSRAGKSGYAQGSKLSHEAKQVKLQKIAEARLAAKKEAALGEELYQQRGVPTMGGYGMPKKRRPDISKAGS